MDPAPVQRQAGGFRVPGRHGTHGLRAPPTPRASAPSSPGQLCPRQPEKLTWGPKYLGDTRGGSTASAPPRHPRSGPLPHTHHSVPPALGERLAWEGGGPETRDPDAGRTHAHTHAGLPALWPFKADFSAVDLGAGKASRAPGGGRLPSRKWRRRVAADPSLWRASAAGGGLLSKLPPLPRLFPQLRGPWEGRAYLSALQWGRRGVRLGDSGEASEPRMPESTRTRGLATRERLGIHECLSLSVYRKWNCVDRVSPAGVVKQDNHTVNPQFKFRFESVVVAIERTDLEGVREEQNTKKMPCRPQRVAAAVHAGPGSLGSGTFSAAPGCHLSLAHSYHAANSLSGYS